MPTTGPAKAAHLGSLDDVRPVELYPEYVWVFVIPEPGHAIAAKHWLPNCHGHKFLRGTILFDSIARRLSDWTCLNDEPGQWVFGKGDRRLTVYPNSAVGGADESLSASAKA